MRTFEFVRRDSVIGSAARHEQPPEGSPQLGPAMLDRVQLLAEADEMKRRAPSVTDLDGDPQLMLGIAPVPVGHAALR